MAKEPVKIMKRRFTSRILESGLLILAVALGVGAAASGLSLLFHTGQYSREMLESPAYRELIVTTQDNLIDMEQAVAEKLQTEYTTLTAFDLKAAELVPQVNYAYIQSNTWMGFMTEELLEEKGMAVRGPRRSDPLPVDEKETGEKETGEKARDSQSRTIDESKQSAQNTEQKTQETDDPSAGSGTDKEDMDEGVRKFYEMVEVFKKAKDNPEFIIPEIENISGFRVTPQFFDAWNIEASQGSLFTSADMTTSDNVVLLGSKAAELLVGSNGSTENITGKKLISYDTYYTVIGILEPTGTDYDKAFFRPDTIFDGGEKFQGRNRHMNRQLRFAVTDPSDLDTAAVILKDWFEKSYGEGQIAVSNPRSEADKLVNRNRGISFLILFLSLAGLFIASVNVSNILMSRTLRMRKHVGILKALGASKNDVLKLFAGEAALITFIGSAVGLVLAYPLSSAMQTSLGLGQGSWFNILAGVLLSSMLTLIFSILPAWQNSGIEAADAMRSAG